MRAVLSRTNGPFIIQSMLSHMAKDHKVPYKYTVILSDNSRTVN